jgi:hypothetical protein
MSWSLACPDWADRLRAGRSLVPDLPIDLAQGNRAVAVFNKLRLADVPGTPTMEEAAGDAGAMWLPGFAAWVEAQPKDCQPDGAHFTLTSLPSAAPAAPAKADAAKTAPAAAAAEPEVKKSKSNICHDKTSPGYKQTKNFTEFKTMDECVKSGGRPPKGNK